MITTVQLKIRSVITNNSDAAHFINVIQTGKDNRSYDFHLRIRTPVHKAGFIYDVISR